MMMGKYRLFFLLCLVFVDVHVNIPALKQELEAAKNAEDPIPVFHKL